MKVTEWLAQAKATLQTAELEPVISEVLMQRQMGWTKTQMVLSRHELVPTTVLAMLDEQLSRALAGEPVQYITGCCCCFESALHRLFGNGCYGCFGDRVRTTSCALCRE